jgi:amicyanin
MKKNVIIGGILVAILAAAAVVLVMGSSDKQASTVNAPEDHSTAQSQSSSQSTEQQAATSSEAVAADEVKISNYAYSPAVIKVKVGQTVTWTNEDAVQHDVMADTMSADAPSSELLAKGESYSFTFKKAGTYTYHCTPHPYMKGTVVVEE